MAGATVTAIFDVSERNAAKLVSELGRRSAASLDELLASDDVDALVIASPDDLHCSMPLRV